VAGVRDQTNFEPMAGGQLDDLDPVAPVKDLATGDQQMQGPGGLELGEELVVFGQAQLIAAAVVQVAVLARSQRRVTSTCTPSGTWCALARCTR
jgi:hypothetical protein